ncbi:hypothetical protein PVAND_002526 [Polypedilum vanderplanki]|uniref:C2H2-type domain-containing protein n=1 Tax=Polypedilum vanderplanki TaxID=319348 RepID=A0A9J6BSF2_POLVA|nr:hypothetical protein PVAND_002526 [Polypedilum vanderplanki]
MERIRQTLRFDKCLSCSKNYNISQLIELNTNSVVVGEENEILFSELLLDVCLQKFDDDKAKYLCESCKDQLILFHMFKRDIKKYNDFQTYITRQQLLLKIDDALTQISDLSNYSVRCINESIIISKDSDDNNINEPIIEEEEIVVEDVSSVIIEEEYIDDTEQICDDPSFNVNEEIIEMEEESTMITDHSIEQPLQPVHIEYQEDDIQKEDWNESSESLAKQRKKYVYKTNTNNDLTEEQAIWIKQQVRKSEVIVEGKKIYKCQICGQLLRIPGSLKKHLRDCHVLKTPNEQEEKSSKQAFKDEIMKSKIDIETNEGVETIWKCLRCTHDRVFRSEAGLKVHLRYSHIRDQIIDAQFIAKCKVSINTATGNKDAWRCPDCLKILRSRDGLRNHMKLEHTESIEQLPNQSFRCNYNKVCSSTENLDKNSLLQLAKKRQSDLSNSICCEQCGISFINGTTKKEKSSDIHQQLHIILKVVSKSYDLPRCEDCKIMFSNNEDLNLHSQSHDDETFPTEGLSYLVAERIKDPIGTAIANDSNSWRCGHCPNVRFADEIDCIEHLMILHSKVLICPFDYLEFSEIRGLGLFCNHMKHKHSEMFPELQIFCTYCQKEFTNVFDKLSHMKICNEKKYSCDHCSKTFFKKTQLIRHLKVVSGAIAFTCDICSKTCASSMDLKLHYRSHTNIKTYNCTFPNCQKIFKTPAARSSHMEIHSNIEYECTDCKTIFKQRALLQRHLKKVKCKGIHATTKSNFYKM